MKNLITAALIAAAASPAAAMTPLLDTLIENRDDPVTYSTIVGTRCAAVYGQAASDAMNTPAMNHMADGFAALANEFLALGAMAIQQGNPSLSVEQATEVAAGRFEIAFNAYGAETEAARTLHGAATPENTNFWNDIAVCKQIATEMGMGA